MGFKRIAITFDMSTVDNAGKLREQPNSTALPFMLRLQLNINIYVNALALRRYYQGLGRILA
jgi:hypothetical protein